MSRPRVGFLGVGWIGRNRMAAMIDAGLVEPVAIADPAPECLAEAAVLAPGAERLESLEDLLARRIDGLVIATPSALHAGQAIRALERGVAVFCQKPLGRNGAEVRAVVEVARRADRLLGVDLSYRHTAGMQAIRAAVRDGALGHVHAADLIFHNAFGPDKPWFQDPALSGGGCVMDLGVHLVDLALWVLDFPRLLALDADLFVKGRPLTDRDRQVEDHAVATLRLAGGTLVRLACSWHLNAGTDAVIGAEFHGDRAGAAFRNVGGSFYDFTADLLHGTTRTALAAPPDAWSGRAAMAWAAQLARSPAFDAAALTLVDVACILDGIYAAAAGTHGFGHR